MSPRCEVAVPARTYSRGGRCSKTAGVKRVVISEGSDQMPVKACAHHRRMVEEKRPVAIAR